MIISEKAKNKTQKYSRTLFFLLAWILLLGIITQISLAGLAVSVDGGLWQKHRDLVKVIEFIPSFMFILGIAGGIHKLYNVISFVLFFFINFQYYTPYGWLGAIHAAFTLVLFMVSLYVAWGSYKIMANDKKKNNDTTISNIRDRDSLHESINGNGNSNINEAG
ncbi:hypothetical protein HHO41_05760 [Bacillus sp. DNRA2]|uniref:DUF6220 domain-containing protein n=1 Tax=Bacillus sp. DNRA2 TaxID=2723053 RepID=UPI00145F0E79|nr:DUF6220 domain-containing protein [Bacillus sp. DNRA2]NMD69786.1 hypothetical protein [Bacillus sp. DNRA2]